MSLAGAYGRSACVWRACSDDTDDRQETTEGRHRTTVRRYEAIVGGLVNPFTGDGFTWDGGIRAMEDSGIVVPMLESPGIDVPFVRSTVSIGIEDRVIPVESPANLADYEELLVHLYPESREDIRKTPASTLYLAVDRDPSWFAAKSNGRLFYTPSRQGVGASLQAELAALLSRAADARADEFLTGAWRWLEHSIRYTTFEISIPVLKDPSLAPPGKTGLIDALDGSIYPGIREAIVDRFAYTPSSIARVVGSTDGAITGWAFGDPVMPATRSAP